MSASFPVVSVVIPCFNQGAFLEDALQSLWKQSFKDFEVIVVDDGSDDAETIAAIDALEHDQLRVIRTHNQGLSQARNTGVEQARGEFVCCLDADDYYADDFLEKTVAVLKTDSQTQLGFVTTWAQLVGKRQELWETLGYDPKQLGKMNVVHAGSLFRKQAWLDVGGYNTDMKQGYEDWDFWIALVEKGYKWQVVKEPLFHYRVRSHSMVSSSHKVHDRLYADIVRQHPEYFKKYAPEILIDLVQDQFQKERNVSYLNEVVLEKNERLEQLEKNTAFQEQQLQQFQKSLSVQEKQFSTVQERIKQQEVLIHDLQELIQDQTLTLEEKQQKVVSLQLQLQEQQERIEKQSQQIWQWETTSRQEKKAVEQLKGKHLLLQQKFKEVQQGIINARQAEQTAQQRLQKREQQMEKLLSVAQQYKGDLTLSQQSNAQTGQQLQSVSEQLEKTQRDLELMTSEKQSFERQFYQLKRSWSWRLSAPVRWIGSALKAFYHIAKRVLPLSWRRSIGGRFIQWRNHRSLRKISDSQIMPMSDPLVSVIIPIYDRTDELIESIESILEQSYQHFELLLVLDGSPETTRMVAHRYIDHPKVKIFEYFDQSGNAVRGRNKGILEAKGEYIAFQDSDDIADPDRLKKSLEFLHQTHADVVYGGWKVKLDGTRKVDGLTDGQEIYSPDCDVELLLKTCVPCQSTVLLKKSVLDDVGGLKPELEYREDHELWTRLASYGYSFKAVPEVLSTIRLHKGNNELNFKKDDDHWYQLLQQEYRRKKDPLQKIAYILPGLGISGGVGVVLQHANRLLKQGYDVLLINQGNDEELNWFPNNAVPIVSLQTNQRYHFENIDVLIATGWTTASVLDVLPASRKLYFVQSDERRFYDDDATKQQVHRSYSTDCEYMTECKWIQRWLRNEFGHDAHYVPNGLDQDLFHRTQPITQKGGRLRVLLEGPIDIPFKGMDDAYAAVKDLDCEIWVVSSSGKPKRDWKVDRFFEAVPMHQMKEIYSACDVFLKMSRVEGFFGPPLEAMACGAAVVVGKVTGYDEYIQHEKNALVVEQGDVQGAKQAVERLLKDASLRKQLVEEGYKTVQHWTWDRSVQLLQGVLSA